MWVCQSSFVVCYLDYKNDLKNSAMNIFWVNYGTVNRWKSRIVVWIIQTKMRKNPDTRMNWTKLNKNHIFHSFVREDNRCFYPLRHCTEYHERLILRQPYFVANHNFDTKDIRRTLTGVLYFFLLKNILCISRLQKHSSAACWFFTRYNMFAYHHAALLCVSECCVCDSSIREMHSSVCSRKAFG